MAHPDNKATGQYCRQFPNNKLAWSPQNGSIYLPPTPSHAPCIIPLQPLKEFCYVCLGAVGGRQIFSCPMDQPQGPVSMDHKIRTMQFLDYIRSSMGGTTLMATRNWHVRSRQGGKQLKR